VWIKARIFLVWNNPVLLVVASIKPYFRATADPPTLTEASPQARSVRLNS